MSAVLVDLEQLAELVARRVVEMLTERDQAPTTRLVDAATIARLLGISRSSVYQHAELLGAVEIGDGSPSERARKRSGATATPRPRLRFDVARARAAWSARVSSERSRAAEVPASAAVRHRRRSAKSGGGARLLPVKGQEAA